MLVTDVVIVGGGPNGLMLACELVLAGVRPVVLESLPAPSEEPKANGLLGQVVKMIDRRGLYERLSGVPGPPQPNSAYFMFAGMGLDLSLLPDSPIYGLPAPQQRGGRAVIPERGDDVAPQPADLFSTRDPDRQHRLRGRLATAVLGGVV